MSPLLCVPVSALVSTCVKVMKNTILASRSAILDFMTFYLDTYGTHIITVIGKKMLMMVMVRLRLRDLSAYNGAQHIIKL